MKYFKKSIVALTVVLAFASIPAAQASVLNDLAWKFFPNTMGVGGKTKPAQSTSWFDSADAFDPANWSTLNNEQQTGLIALMEFTSRTGCQPNGARGFFWGRAGDQDYENSRSAAHQAIVIENIDAARFKDVPFDAPIRGARAKAEADDENGLMVHSKMQMVRASSAHVGISCGKALPVGSLVLDAAIYSAEAWVGSDSKVYFRVPDKSANKHISSTTHVLSWDEVYDAQKSLSEQDKVNNF